MNPDPESRLDPDSMRVPGSVSGSEFAIRIRSQEGKTDPQTYRTKLINFIFEVLDVLRPEGFSCSLDVSKLQFLIRKR